MCYLNRRFNLLLKNGWCPGTNTKVQLNLEDAFDALPLRVVAVVTVQLAVRVANELQQPLGLNVHQDGVLKGTAVL